MGYWLREKKGSYYFEKQRAEAWLGLESSGAVYSWYHFSLKSLCLPPPPLKHVLNTYAIACKQKE